MRLYVVVVLVLLSENARKAHGDQGTLLLRDQTDNGWMWTSYKLGAGNGWIKDVTTGSYAVCDLVSTKTNQTDSWLMSEFIQLHGANEVYIELTFTARKCPGGIFVYCTEYFNVFAMHADSAITGGLTQSLIENRNFSFIQNVTADSVWTSGQTSVNNVAMVTLLPSRGGLYLALQDVGACIGLSKVAVRHNYCSAQIKNGVTYHRTTAPSSLQGVTQVRGNCSANAVPYPLNSTHNENCSASGHWTVVDPSYACLCKAGYQSSGPAACEACPGNKYKPSNGNAPCNTCPDHTHSTAMHDSCACDAGFYRAVRDPAHGKCTAPPTKPKNLTAVLIDNVYIVTWQPPLDNGGRNDVTYDVTCHRCLNNACNEDCNDVVIQPANQDLAMTHVIIRMNGNYGDFKITVFAKNGVSQVAGAEKLSNENIKVSSSPVSTAAATAKNTTTAATTANSTESKVPGAGTEDQLGVAIGVSVAVTFIVCFLITAIVIFILSKKWRSQVKCSTTGSNGHLGDSLSTIETDFNESFVGQGNEAFFIDLPTRGAHVPKINVLEMQHRKDSLAPHSPRVANGSVPDHLSLRRPSREAWPTEHRKSKRNSKEIGLKEELAGSAVSVKSWYPEKEIQFNV